MRIHTGFHRFTEIGHIFHNKHTNIIGIGIGENGQYDFLLKKMILQSVKQAAKQAARKKKSAY